MEKLPQSKINFAKNTQAPKTQNKPAVKNQIQTNKNTGANIAQKINTAQTAFKNSENELVEFTAEEESSKKGSAAKIPDKYANDDWSPVEPAKNKVLFIETGSYTYTTNNGAKIKLDNIDENTFVLENKETGEIVIIGANDTDIEGDNSNVKLTILDSNVNKIKMGKGNDNITLENSTADSIEGGKGNDVINIKNSTVTNSIKGGDNEDYIYAVNSKIGTIESGKGDDDISVSNSTVAKIDGGKGNDVILANSSSNIEEIFGGKGDDLINIVDSSVTKLDSGKGKDSLKFENADIKETVEDENDTVYEKTTTVSSPYDVIDPDSIEEAKEITNNKTSKYSDGELTPEQEIHARTIDLFSQNLENMKSQFEEQENEDGAIRDTYNWVKELIDMGVSKEDIKAAINEQERMVSELTSALNGEGDASFEEVFEKWTGTKYNEEAATKYLETSQMYSLAVNGLYKADNFKNMVSNASSLGEVLDYYTQYFGSEEEGRAQLNKMLQEAFLNEEYNMDFGFPISVEINENNELVVKRPKEYGVSGALPDTEYETTVENINDVTNMFNTMPRYFDLDQYTNDFKAQFEETTGKSIEELQNEYKINQLNAFGSGNSFQKLIDRYCAEQEGFADKLASAAQIGGIGLMVVGGIVTFVCPPAGVAMMNAGKYTALAGMFGDNAIELIDDLASENGLSKDEAWDLMKESITELALLYSGAKINGVARGVKDMVLSETQSKALAFLSEIGTDASLSLLTDLMITGEVNLTGEGISQLLGIVTGLAGAKVDAYTKEAFEAADTLYKNGDIDSALEYLNGKGLSQKQIENHYSSMEMDRINKIYEETGDIKAALNEVSSSKILNKLFYKNKIQDINSVNKQQAVNIMNELVDMGVRFDSSIDILSIFNNPGEISKEFFDDLVKYRNAVKNNIPIEDAFIPKFATGQSAINNANVGDVFFVNDTNSLCIKLSNGKMQPLNISAKAYLELFPPVERYATMQNQSGDCYLVSTVDGMFKDPAARATLLKCFTENADGTIKVRIGDTSINFQGTYFGDVSHIDGNYKYGGDFNVSGTSGMKMLEEAFGFAYISKYTERLQKIMSSYPPDSEKYKEAYDDYIKLQDPNYMTDHGAIARSNGGWMSDVYEIFGLEDIKTASTSSSILTNPKNWDKYIFSAATNGNNDRIFINEDLQIAGGHAYNIEPFLDTDGNVMIKVTNPWSCANNVILTLKDFKKYFGYITIAKKP